MYVTVRDAAPVGMDRAIVTIPEPASDPAMPLSRHDATGDTGVSRPIVHSPEGLSQPALSQKILWQSTLSLGSVTIARIVFHSEIPVDEAVTGLLFIPDDRRLTLYDGTSLDVRAGDLVALPVAGLLRGIDQRPLACAALLASRRFLGAAMPSRSSVVILPRSASIDALHHHVERLRAMAPGALDAAQAQAAARSIREMLAAAAVPVAAVRHRGVQREEALLDRILDHVDATLGADVSIALLCEELACSRSALYRAAAPRGGLVKIVMQQRLLAVHGALRRGDDRRSIAEIARAHGFADASQFSRCFRRAFGVSAGRVRTMPGHGTADGVLCHPDTARLFALTDAGPDGGVRDSH